MATRITRSGGQTVSGGGGGDRGLGRGLLEAFVADFILDKVGGGLVNTVANPRGGGFVAPPSPAAQGSKYNLTAPDIIAVQSYVNAENLRREGLNAIPGGVQLPYLRADQIINDMVYTNRKLMEEAGARERALAAIDAQARVQAELARAQGSAVTEGLRGLSDVEGRGLTEATRRFTDPSLAELARPI